LLRLLRGEDLEFVSRGLGVTADYPTRARQPANSALDCTRFERAFGLAPRPWGDALAEVMDRIGAEVYL
jgi:dTDP-4-dehydrorhamnose reductase